MAMIRSGLPLPVPARRTHMRLVLTWPRPRRSRLPTLCVMMFLSRSVYLYQGKSVSQFLTKCALTNHCRSARTYQDKPVMLFIRRCLSGLAGGCLKKVCQDGQVLPVNVVPNPVNSGPEIVDVRKDSKNKETSLLFDRIEESPSDNAIVFGD